MVGSMSESADRRTAGTGTPSIRRVLETALYVDDLDRAKAFYRDVLGLPFHSESPDRHVFFRCGEGMLLLFRAEETEKPGDVPVHGARGAGHVCFAVDRTTLEAWKRKLIAAGVEIESDYPWNDRGRSIYFRDPAGNSLELSNPEIWGASEA
jgi:catechol 2,3-dioxygenase-like lactoylglutathione lyase family enzyme